MKLFLQTILKFSGVAMISYLVLLFTFGMFAPYILNKNQNYNELYFGFLNTRLKEVKTTKDVDILFLGNSHAYRGFDTRIFAEAGYTSFNLGSSSQTPIQTLVLLKRYLNQLNPKLIVYEVSPQILESDGVESALDVIANDINDIYSLKMALITNHLRVYNTILVGVFKDLLGISNKTESVMQEGDTYIKNGFVDRKLSYFKKMQYPENKWIYKAKQLDALDQTLDLITHSNYKLIMVQAPVTSTLYNSYINNYEFDSLIITKGTYYNLNNALPLDDSVHFYDSHHLNKNGVALLNRKVINILKETELN